MPGDRDGTVIIETTESHSYIVRGPDGEELRRNTADLLPLRREAMNRRVVASGNERVSDVLILNYQGGVQGPIMESYTPDIGISHPTIFVNSYGVGNY